MNKIAYLCLAFIFSFSINTKSENNDVLQNSETNAIQRVRLDFVTPLGYTRHLLLSFISDNSASDDFDYGYDALNGDNFPDDMNWMINDQRYVIQGVGAFDENKYYPLGIFLSNSGQIEINLFGLENFDTNIDVYIYDALLGTFNSLSNSDYMNTLSSGNYLNRFYVTFTNDANQLNITNPSSLSLNEIDVNNATINYLKNTNEIYISSMVNSNLKAVTLLNFEGKKVKEWKASNFTIADSYRIPVENVNDGFYILKVETESKTYNKKVIIKTPF